MYFHLRSYALKCLQVAWCFSKVVFSSKLYKLMCMFLSPSKFLHLYIEKRPFPKACFSLGPLQFFCVFFLSEGRFVTCIFSLSDRNYNSCNIFSFNAVAIVAELLLAINTSCSLVNVCTNSSFLELLV